MVYYRTEQNFQQDIFLRQFEPMTILPDFSDLVLEQVRLTNEVTITVGAASPTAPCPCCGTISKRIQSRYRILRTLADREYGILKGCVIFHPVWPEPGYASVCLVYLHK